MAENQRNAGGRGRKMPVGVWNRGRGSGPGNPIRIRTKRLDEVDGDKIALAYWLLAKQIVSNQSDAVLSEAEVRRLAAEVASQPAPADEPEPAASNEESNGRRAGS